ncbi:hypothetical protein BT93_H3185 [Corymbia citriodora subsp. variegata]|nr:hypothetical protein BT93_H3185 [Corymbia citriodora subsp. variegata]
MESLVSKASPPPPPPPNRTGEEEIGRAAMIHAQQPRRKGIGTKAWLIVSESGQSHVEEIEKHSIMRRTGLPARDLRVLDPVLSYPSSILGRERAVVVNLEHIKAIITAKEVLMINTNSPLVYQFVQDLQHRVSSPNSTSRQEVDGRTSPASGVHKTLPFEFRALESCLESACQCLESEVRDELEHLLDDDNDMAEMFLTEKLLARSLDNGSIREEVDNATPEIDDERAEDSNEEDELDTAVWTSNKPNIEELEMLLEAYFVQIDGVLQKLSDMNDYVDDTEDCINIMLDDKQNQLLQMGVMLYTANMIVNAGIVVVGLFGMNIEISLFSAPHIKFWETIIGTVGGCVVIYLIAVGWGMKTKLLAL